MPRVIALVVLRLTGGEGEFGLVFIDSGINIIGVGLCSLSKPRLRPSIIRYIERVDAF